MPTLFVEAIDHLVLNVNDIDVSFDWYSNILGMRGKKIVSKKKWRAKKYTFLW
ncbi:VOC family protein [Bombella saccharophila]|uniref:VOC family protein n=1 Tax=Bombella saccharophila TaxID=2967338 RepID=A0ABT3W5Y1_9PROT|nr:VOC family protein [Bombella saccharophila]MCX5614103.1 VOC family protein [Bombella saccharophila]